MVQYFGEQLHGFVFTQSGWVQSYGSRYVNLSQLVPTFISCPQLRPTAHHRLRCQPTGPDHRQME
jgi:hypothetical protein